jgi:hypothetical protein
LDTWAALATSATVTSRRREASVLISAFLAGLDALLWLGLHSYQSV